MEEKRKAATRRDIEYTQAQTELERVRATAERNRTVGQGIRGAIIVGSFALPLWAMQGVIEPLAGETTIVEASMVLSASVTVSVVGNGLQYLKGRSQRKEIRRLRQRVTDLERRLSSGDA